MVREFTCTGVKFASMVQSRPQFVTVIHHTGAQPSVRSGASNEVPVIYDIEFIISKEIVFRRHSSINNTLTC